MKVSFTELSFWWCFERFLMSVSVTTDKRSQIIEDKIKTTTLSWRNLLRKSKRNQRVRAAQTYALEHHGIGSHDLQKNSRKKFINAV